MSGASDSAVAAAIGAIALADADQKPSEFDTPRNGEQIIKSGGRLEPIIRRTARSIR